MSKATNPYNADQKCWAVLGKTRGECLVPGRVTEQSNDDKTGERITMGTVGLAAARYIAGNQIGGAVIVKNDPSGFSCHVYRRVRADWSRPS